MRIPLEVREDVAVIVPPVIDPPVNVEKIAVAAFRSVAKKFVVVAEVKIGVSESV